MFLKVVIYRNVSFTHSNTQKDLTYLSLYELRTFCHRLRLVNYKKNYLHKEMIKSETRYSFSVKHGNRKTWHCKTGGSKRQKCNDRHFLIIRFFRNQITLLTDVSKSCNLSECFLHSFKHSKRYNRAKTKTCYLPGYGLLIENT